MASKAFESIVSPIAIRLRNRRKTSNVDYKHLNSNGFDQSSTPLSQSLPISQSLTMDTSDSFLLTDSQDSHESTGLVSPDRLRVSSQLSNLFLSGLTHAEITTDSFSLSNSTLFNDQHNLSASPNAPSSATEDPQELSVQSHLSYSANVTTIPDSQASQQPSDSGSDSPAPPTDYDGRNRNTSTSDNTLMQVNLTQANGPPDEATLAPVIRDLLKKRKTVYHLFCSRRKKARKLPDCTAR